VLTSASIRHRHVRAAAVRLLAMLLLVSSASADEQSGDGVVFLGAGFTGPPFHLGGDLVLETDGLWNAIRDHEGGDLPEWVAWHDVSSGAGPWGTVQADGTLVVVVLAGGQGGAQLWDLADPHAPQLRWSLTGTSYRSALLDDSLLVLASDNLMLAWDVTAPSAPTLRLALPLALRDRPRWPCAVGDVVVLAESDTAVRVLGRDGAAAVWDHGVADIATGRLDALAAGAGRLHALVSAAGAATDSVVTLDTFDLTDPAAPARTQSRTLATGQAARGLALVADADLLLAAALPARTVAFDLADADRPAPGFELPVAARRLAITAARLLTWNGVELGAYTRSPAATAPDLLSARRALPALERLGGHGPVLLAQSSKDRSVLLPVDLAEAANPRLLDGVDMGLDGTLVQRGTVAALLAGDDLQAVDLADPRAPVRGGALRLPADADPAATVCDGRLACVGAADADAIWLVDLADPARPRLAGTIPLLNTPLAASGGAVLALDAPTVQWWDVTDPAAPEYRDILPVTGFPHAAALAGGHAFCLTGPDGDALLEVFDLASGSPQAVASLPVGRVGDLVVHDRRLYLRDDRHVTIIDIADPAAVAIAATMDLAFPAQRHLGVHGDLVVATANLVTIRDLTWRPVSSEPPPATCRLAAAWPNPFNPAVAIALDMDRARWAAVTVCDLRGRRVATLAGRAFAAGRHTLTWRGEDDSGRRMPSGRYLVVLDTDGVTSALPVTLAR
jgi:hypothetical protein